MLNRDIYTAAWETLVRDKGLILLTGPRQVGKTTLARMLLQRHTNGLYFNWDIPDHRSRLVSDPVFFEADMVRRDETTPLVVFDELHKYREWKNYLKGLTDRFGQDYRFLVTGSGRLEMFQTMGDSLAGRYALFHMWPVTLAEVSGARRDMEDFRSDPLELDGGAAELYEEWKRIMEFSGFPEPFLAARKDHWRRWTRTHSHQLVREDIRDLTAIRNLESLQLLYESLLPPRVGSPVSLSKLSGIMRVAHNTVTQWLLVLEKFYLVFRVRPWHRRISRAVVKEPKFYFFNLPLLREPAARFENAVALELLRAVSLWNDLGWGDFTLNYVRDRDKREVDFLIADEGEPLLLVETKLSDRNPSPALRRFQELLRIPAVQLVHEVGPDEGFRLFTGSGGNKILVAPAWRWLAQLP